MIRFAGIYRGYNNAGKLYQDEKHAFARMIFLMFFKSDTKEKPELILPVQVPDFQILKQFS
jgi:hypothetical protein